MSLKHVQICFIYKQKYAYLKAIKSEMQTNFKAEPNLKKI